MNEHIQVKIEQARIEVNFQCEGRIADMNNVPCGRRVCVGYTGRPPLWVECPQCFSKYRIGVTVETA